MVEKELPDNAFPDNFDQVGTEEEEDVVYCPHCDILQYRGNCWPTCNSCDGPVFSCTYPEKAKQQYRLFFRRMNSRPDDIVFSPNSYTENVIKASEKIEQLDELQSNVLSDDELAKYHTLLGDLKELMHSIKYDTLMS